MSVKRAGISISVLALLLIACQLISTPVPAITPTPTPTWTPTPQPSPSPTPSPTIFPTSTHPPSTLTPTVHPTSLPITTENATLPTILTTISFTPTEGIYAPFRIALDPAQGVLYALGSCTHSSPHEGKTCIVTLDLHDDQLQHRAVVPGYPYGTLALSDTTLYAAMGQSANLLALDRDTLTARQVITSAVLVAVNDQGDVYAVTPDRIALLRPNPIAVPLPQPDIPDSPIALLATAKHVYLLGYRTLRIFDPTLHLLRTIDLSKLFPQSIAFDRVRNRLYIGGTTGLYALEDQRPRPLLPTLGMVKRLALTPSGQYIYALVYHPEDWFGRHDLVAITTTTWQTRTLYSTLEGFIPDMALDVTRERLLLTDYSDHALIPISLPSGRIGRRVPLGLQVEEVIVDQAGGRVYISDSAGRVHILRRDTYEQIGQLYGGRYISLDVPHGRLYAGDPRVPVVSVFDVSDLESLHEIKQAGKPRADPVADRVIVINRRVYTFDGATGQPQGEMMPSVGHPPAGCPGCFYTIAREVIVDARRGLTAAITYTPWPGKPGPQESIVYNPADGRTYYSLLTGGYVHFSSIAIYQNLRALEERQSPTLTLHGLSGHLALDPAAQRLYVTRGPFLFILDSDTLHRLGRVKVEGWSPVVAAVDDALGRLYTPRDNEVVVWARTGSAPPPPLPPEPCVITRTVAAIIPSPNYAQDHTLLATIDDRLCRSTDGGDTWERLRGGLPEIDDYRFKATAIFSPDYARDRTIFAGIFLGDSHGEGVWRSTDGGDTWQPGDKGLYALRVYRLVTSSNYAHDRTLLAYAYVPTGTAIYRSSNGGESWQLVLSGRGNSTPPLPRPVELLPAPPLPLLRFECTYEGHCQRSDDGGQTWSEFDSGPAALKWLVAAVPSPHFVRDHTIYFATKSDLYRYLDDRRSWFRCTLPIMSNREHYTRNLTALATAATADGGHVILLGSAAGEFYRLPANRVTWQPLQQQHSP